MAEIEILLPTVQYGNVRITGTPEEFGVELNAPGSIGEMAAVYLNLFTQGFQAGALRDVEYHGNNVGTTDVDMTAKATIQSELGASVLMEYNHDGPGDVDAAHTEAASETPWDGEVPASPKPWENNGAPKAPVKVEAAAPAKINW